MTKQRTKTSAELTTKIVTLRDTLNLSFVKISELVGLSNVAVFRRYHKEKGNIRKGELNLSDKYRQDKFVNR